MDRDGYLWVDAPVDRRAEALMADCGFIPPLARAAVARGIQPGPAIKRFMCPRLADIADPMLMPGMSAAVERLVLALERGEMLAVYGDYDVDGLTATVLLVQVWRELGGRARPFIPERLAEGYGLTREGLQRCRRECEPDLLVTVDCGTNSVEAVAAAMADGLPVIVTDHHEPGERIAPATAVVNPHLDAAGDNVLAGVGVAFKLCHGLVKVLRRKGHIAAGKLDLRRHLFGVAVGTVCDMVSLRGENRTLVKRGLDMAPLVSAPGWRALRQVAGVGESIDTFDLGYRLGPRLNAAGRLSAARKALRLLLTNDPAEAARLARELDDANRERRALQKRIFEDARRQVETWFRPDRHYAVIAAGEQWHPGVIGIVASRLVEIFRRPAVVVALAADGSGRGSCRSVEGFDIFSALSACDGCLQRWGGHPMAAGLQLPPGGLKPFSEHFLALAADRLSGSDLRPRLAIDSWLEPGGINARLYAGGQAFSPFGADNPRLVWAVRGVTMRGAPAVLKERHLRFQFNWRTETWPGIAFGMAGRSLPPQPWDVAFCLQRNDWRSDRRLEWLVQDIRAAEE